MPHRDSSVAIKQAITQAVNATQGHKLSDQTRYYTGYKCQALNRSLPYAARYDLNPHILTGYTVIKQFLITKETFREN